MASSVKDAWTWWYTLVAILVSVLLLTEEKHRNKHGGTVSEVV